MKKFNWVTILCLITALNAYGGSDKNNSAGTPVTPTPRVSPTPILTTPTSTPEPTPEPIIPAYHKLIGLWKDDRDLLWQIDSNSLSQGWLDEVYDCIQNQWSSYRLHSFNETIFFAEYASRTFQYDYEFTADNSVAITSKELNIENTKIRNDLLESIIDLPYASCYSASRTGKISISLGFVNKDNNLAKASSFYTNHESVSVSAAIYFDLNNNGRSDIGDINTYGYLGILDKDSSNNLQVFPGNLYIYIRDSLAPSFANTEISATEEGFVISINKSEHPALALISNATPISIDLRLNATDRELLHDTYPNDGTFTKSEDSKQLQDSSNDAPYDMSVLGIDLKNVRVEITD